MFHKRLFKDRFPNNHLSICNICIYVSSSPPPYGFIVSLSLVHSWDRGFVSNLFVLAAD